MAERAAADEFAVSRFPSLTRSRYLPTRDRTTAQVGRAARPAVDPDPTTGAGPRSHRSGRLRAAAVGGALAILAAGGCTGVPGAAANAGSRTLATLAPTRLGLDAIQSVRLPAAGLTFAVSCGEAEPIQLVLRVAGRWFAGIDCRAPSTTRIERYALPPAAYATYDARTGQRVRLDVVTSEGVAASGWSVRVRSGLPTVAGRAVPEPTALPVNPRLARGSLLVASPSADDANAAGEASYSFTVPRHAIQIVVRCLGLGAVHVQLTTATGSTVTTAAADPCPLFGRPKDDVIALAPPGALPAGVSAGQRLVLRVATSGFTRPTWQVAVVRADRYKTG